MAGQCGHGVGVRGGGRTVCMAHTRVCCAVRVWLCWGGCTLGFCSKGLMSVCVCVCGCAEVVARWDFAARGLCLFVRACEGYPPVDPSAVTARRVQVTASVLRTPSKANISPLSRRTSRRCSALSTARATPNTRNCDRLRPKVCQGHTKRGTRCTRPLDRVKSIT